jgi:hypothetical protein
MAECPSGRYLSEIVTAGGLTPAHPLETPESTLGVNHSLLDWSGSENDYAQWSALAGTLLGRLELAWTEFKAWPTTARMSMEEYRPLETEMNGLRDRWSRMRIPWTTDASAFGTLGWSWGITLPEVSWDSSDEVAQLVQIIVDAQCLRQRLNERLAADGGNPTLPGDTAHTPSSGGLGILGTIALVAAAGGIVYGGITLVRKFAPR